MLNLLKQLFCRHRNETQFQHVRYFDGQRIITYGKRCERCGNVTWL